MSEPTLNLTPAEKKALKAQAHSLDPVVLIGDKGLTAAVLKEIDLALKSHGLIKVRVTGDDREERLAAAEEIVQSTGCALVQHIGKLLVLYRPKPDTGGGDAGKSKAKKQGKAARVTKRQFNAKD